MARFFGKVGYGQMEETRSGVHDEVITEMSYFGDVVRDARSTREGDNVHDDISTTNSISIVADAYANEHIQAMRYVEWGGVCWKISEVEIERPRLILRLGGVYHGPKPDSGSS